MILVIVPVFFYHSVSGQEHTALDFNAYKYGITKNINDKPELPFIGILAVRRDQLKFNTRFRVETSLTNRKIR
jgi:hypothetical protein